MAKNIFVNLPVKDLKKTMNFFNSLGFSFNPQFTDDKAACMVIHDNIYAMFLLEDYFKTFTKKNISDAKSSTEVLIALDAPSRDEVKQIVDKAVQAGGKVYAEPADHGWMYQHSFEDLDGHQWEIAYMDQSQLPSE